MAREEGSLNDIRAILGNDKAIKAYREGKLPFPDGAIIARLAWSHDASEENNKVFGQPQSFVARATKERGQFMVKDSKKYAATGGWGSRISTTVNLPTRPCSTPALPATRPSKIVIWSSPGTRLSTEDCFPLERAGVEINREGPSMKATLVYYSSLHLNEKNRHHKKHKRHKKKSNPA